MLRGVMGVGLNTNILVEWKKEKESVAEAFHHERWNLDLDGLFRTVALHLSSRNKLRQRERERERE